MLFVHKQWTAMMLLNKNKEVEDEMLNPYRVPMPSLLIRQERTEYTERTLVD